MTREVQGYYGLNKPNPTTIFVYDNRNGSRWYVTEGSININKTFDEIELGCNVEKLKDCDFMEAERPVESEEDLRREVEE